MCIPTHCQKMIKKMKILEMFFDILNHHNFDYYHAEFRQNGRKKFSDIFGPFLDDCAAKKIFSPILVIVKIMVIQIIKKSLFFGPFLTVYVNAHYDEQNFCCKIFFCNENDLVQICGLSAWAFKILAFWGVTPKTDMPPSYQAKR